MNGNWNNKVWQQQTGTSNYLFALEVLLNVSCLQLLGSRKWFNKKKISLCLMMCLDRIDFDIRFYLDRYFSHDRIKWLFSSDDDSPCNIDLKISFFLNHGILALLVVNRICCRFFTIACWPVFLFCRISVTLGCTLEHLFQTSELAISNTQHEALFSLIDF